MQLKPQANGGYPQESQLLPVQPATFSADFLKGLQSSCDSISRLEALSPWKELVSVFSWAIIATETPTRLPPGTSATLDNLAEVHLKEVQGLVNTQLYSRESSISTFINGIRNGQRWLKIVEKLGPGCVVLAAGETHGLYPLSTRDCAEVDLDRVMEWVQTARSELVAWSKTWGAIVMRAVMGKFDNEEWNKAIDAEDEVDWKEGMAVVCSQLPWKEMPENLEIWQEDDELVILLARVCLLAAKVLVRQAIVQGEVTIV